MEVSLLPYWVTLAGVTDESDNGILAGLTGLVDSVTAGDESVDGTLLTYWVTLAGLTTLKDSVTTGDDGTLLAYWVTLDGLTTDDETQVNWGTQVNWVTPVGGWRNRIPIRMDSIKLNQLSQN